MESVVEIMHKLYDKYLITKDVNEKLKIVTELIHYTHQFNIALDAIEDSVNEEIYGPYEGGTYDEYFKKGENNNENNTEH